MKSYLELNTNLYSSLSKDTKIGKFNEFHLIEAKSILLFLIQIGNSQSEMLNIFKNMLSFHKRICKKNVYLSCKKSIEKCNSKEIKHYVKELKNDIKEYKKLKLIIKKYINRIDSTSNQEIVSALNSLILYEQIIQKLYKNNATLRKLYN